MELIFILFAFFLGWVVLPQPDWAYSLRTWLRAKTAVRRANNTCALKIGFSHELPQDLRAVHGLDAETELSDILAAGITEAAAMSKSWVVLYWQQETAEFGRWVAVESPTEQDADDLAAAFRASGYRVEIEGPEEPPR